MELSDEVRCMMLARPAERVWLELHEAGPDTDFDALATAASLESLGKGWVKIDAQRAFLVLASLLQKDLAYKSELMPRRRAEWLAHEFLGAFGQYNSKFATNTNDLPGEFPFAWTPATEYTFDSGVAVIGEAGSGVFWVADED